MFYRDKFRKLRRARRISRNVLAEGIGRSLKTIQRWETGDTDPSDFSIRQMADFLSIPVSEISDLNENSEVRPLFYDKLNSLDKSTFDLSTKTDSEKQKLFIELYKKVDVLTWEKNQLMKNSEESNVIISNVDCLIYKKDNKLRYEYVNSKFTAYFNVPDKSLILGHRNSEIWKDANAWKDVKEVEDEVLSKGVNAENKIISLPHFIGPDGVGMLSLKPIYGDNDKVLGIVGTIVDVTGDNVIKEKFSYMESVLDRVDQVIWIIKKEPYRHYLYVNNAVENVYKVYKSDFYKSIDRWQDFIHEEDRRRVLKEYKDGSRELLYRIRVDNELQPVKWIRQNFYFTEINGEQIEFGSINDVTELVNWEKEKEFLQSIIDQLQSSFIWRSVQKQNGEIQYYYISENVKKILGYDRDEFYSKVNPLSAIIHPDHKIILDESVKNIDNNIAELEVLLKTYDNSYKWIDLKVKKVANKDGTLNNYGIATDISEKKELESALHDYYTDELESSKYNTIKAIAGKMKAEGVDIDFISRCTDLSISDI